MRDTAQHLLYLRLTQRYEGFGSIMEIQKRSISSLHHVSL